VAPTGRVTSLTTIRAATADIALVAGGGVVATTAGPPGVASASPPQSRTSSTASTCHLGNGVSHVIDLVFDNVHFARDNPNVPSDLEQMPHLLNFLEQNGTVFSNSHTTIIAHTANDSLSIYTGLYGDRHGQPLSNSYKVYNQDGTTDPAGSFAYWTSQVNDTAAHPTGQDTKPTMAYSSTVPATPGTNQQTPAPWVPFTRAGCNVGNFSTANMDLENTRVDLPTVFGAGSPEVAQYNADTDPFKDAEVADYVGAAIHCAAGNAVCTAAQAVKFGQTSPTPSAVADRLPTEPGGYNGFQGLFGARYIAPQLGAGTPNLTHNGNAVTNAAGNLVDLSGQQINGAFLTNHPGFPGFSPTASQSLAYLADMQESGIPVTYGYISDIHERKAGQSGCTTATATSSGKPVGPGDSCYLSTAKSYDDAFNAFLTRLAADGITPENTEFVVGAEENDQFAGANVGRALQPTPAGCDGVTVPCSYPAGSLGELQANIKGLVSGTASASTPFDIEPQGASIYVHGQPAASDPAVRQLERDTAAMTGDNPFSGATGQSIVKYQASALEERALHMQTADPLRLPTYTLFPVPDYYFSTTGPNVSVNSSFAWNHGYYSPNIDVTWSALVGPGVAHRGVDGPQPAQSNEAHDPNSTHTVPQASTAGTWVEETDLRPTLLNLVGLQDDYVSDGTVITAALKHPSAALTATRLLAAVYTQLNSSVGTFATDTLLADSSALASGSSTSDKKFAVEQAVLTRLLDDRDKAANEIKQILASAAAGHQPSLAVTLRETANAVGLLARAAVLRITTT
jgi:hypothetical protein